MDDLRATLARMGSFLRVNASLFPREAGPGFCGFLRVWISSSFGFYVFIIFFLISAWIRGLELRQRDVVFGGHGDIAIALGLVQNPAILGPSAQQQSYLHMSVFPTAQKRVC